ncbi:MULTISPECIES: efflux RND transporter permease subunit [unclassified Colwellia]|uniref:efflux RND transporter permease subunit n=1 Tax=unclassified Colwellia TaxID=196834 RepID=UPI0015F5C954|nr:MULTISPECIES: efflux RND transporter permease subunit [unclassified Colwellia]MBA6336759.1 efflux RND transporter permease subunit [Colwellia sp. BRX8-7]MBA6355949.1 efflux RND transporter permease subunit [Colwellia sp. BRX8-3]MBA6359611.1 efflux RND transporter permease subunit [Colwellia sp. BRX8-6]MBA6366198.1 efflux RND transporter permease subunit [Colwellia sp. BRX8-5]MBA6369805.1 efflux RND transporter permease subunit [Colwellia sp. BRX8-4]
MDDTNKGLIAWFARNSVAANLLMIFILVGGFFTISTINKQMFPQININWISYTAPYPGAAPQEVEEGITIKVEEALETVQGLKRVITYSNRNFSNGWFEVDLDYDPQVVLEEVKSAIDSISSFPDGMERIKVEREKFRQEVMYISLYGDLTNGELKELGRKVHNEIQQLPLVNIAELYSGLDYEISIEVSKDKLREYGLTFRDVAQAVRGYSGNMSAGQIRAENGYINLRVENQAYRGYEFEQIPIITLADGTKVLLGQMATIIDGFTEGLQYSKFNGENSVSIFIGAADNQSITDVADVINKYVDEKSNVLPAGVKLETWVDMTYYLEGRLTMMIDNMKSGAILVFLMLALFLRVRLAFWVMMGLPVCFLGTLFLMPLEFINVTINVISLFAFILVLGIVVDDAIVMGESAHDEIEQHGHSTENVIRGIQRVAMPATFGVLTTIAVFLPFLFGEGPSAAFGKAIGSVVILCLIFSLIESKLILPAHLVKMKPKVNIIKLKKLNEYGFFWFIQYPLDRITKVVDRLRGAIDDSLKSFIQNIYQPALQKFLDYRYAVLMFFISLMLISAGLFSGGFVRFVGQPKIPHDFPRVNVEMNVDASEKATLQTLLNIQGVINTIDKEIEAQYGQSMISDMQVDLRSRTSGQLMVKLVVPELRPMNTFELADLWRAAIPNYPGVKSFTIGDNLFGSGRDDGDIAFRLESKDDAQLLAASRELKTKLNSLKGIGDVNDSRQTSAKEVQFELKPLAYSLGLTLAEIASQVSYSFYGLEAQRILRDSEEVKVMIRYPLEQRSSVGHVDDVMIKAPNGAELPLSELANITLQEGVTSIRRENGNRTINVWASVDAEQVEPFKVANDIRDNFIPELLRKFPKVQSEVSGSIQEEMEGADNQKRDFIISLLIVFSLLAIPLKSYSQAVMIMIVIPFGIIGSVFGHFLLGMDLSALSVMGILAAAGVVVNDSLVMVDYVNNARKSGVKLKDAVIHAGTKRFRAIMLTSITTFIGLVPIIFFEVSAQAQIVIPMAISLAFGVLFATIVTLVLIPSLYLIIEDMKKIFKRKKKQPLIAENTGDLSVN